jgi:hypothetical protein
LASRLGSPELSHRSRWHRGLLCNTSTGDRHCEASVTIFKTRGITSAAHGPTFGVGVVYFCGRTSHQQRMRSLLVLRHSAFPAWVAADFRDNRLDNGSGEASLPPGHDPDNQRSAHE